MVAFGYISLLALTAVASQMLLILSVLRLHLHQLSLASSVSSSSLRHTHFMAAHLAQLFLSIRIVESCYTSFALQDHDRSVERLV